MPFKSKAQVRKLAILAKEGKFPKSKFMEFANATTFKGLPYKVKKK